MREGRGVAALPAGGCDAAGCEGAGCDGTACDGYASTPGGRAARAAAGSGGGAGLTRGASGKRDFGACAGASGVAEANDTSLGIFRSTIFRVGGGGAPESDIDMLILA